MGRRRYGRASSTACSPIAAIPIGARWPIRRRSGARARRGCSITGPAAGAPVLVVPSLVNRAYMLDLTPERSLLRHWAARACGRCWSIGARPGEAERGFDLTDYIAGAWSARSTRLPRARAGPRPLVGYCMGGLLALALALRRTADLGGLVLLATPWDFHAERAERGARASARSARR